MSSVEIDFDNKVRALIFLVSQPNRWEPMRAMVSNSVGSAKLNFSDVKDRILTEEVCKIDYDDASTSNSTLNVKGRDRGSHRNSNQNKGRSKLRNDRNNSKFRRYMECWNYGKRSSEKGL